MKHIHFGILINLGIINKHYLSETDPLKRDYFKKIDVHHYLYPFDDETTYEDFERECENFKGWADQITATDGDPIYNTEFYLICYTTDPNGKVTEYRGIKKLYY